MLASLPSAFTIAGLKFKTFCSKFTQNQFEPRAKRLTFPKTCSSTKANLWPVKPWLELRFLGKLMTFREVMRNKTLEEVRATLAINLRTIRLSKGIAQERLALDAGVDRTVVSKIERAVTNPSIEVLLKLANQLDVDLTDLFVN